MTNRLVRVFDSATRSSIPMEHVDLGGEQRFAPAVVPVGPDGGPAHVVVDAMPAGQGGSAGLTDAQLRATPVPVTGAFYPGVQPVSGPVTDAQLRASPVPVAGPLTDAQVRATPLPVSGPLTDAQLRAGAVPVSLASIPLPGGAASEATLAALLAKLLGPATLAATATGVAAAALTLTLPAVPGQFHRLALLEVVMYATAARTGAAAPVVVTTTNLPGNLAFTLETAQAIGTRVVERIAPAVPLRAAAAGVATTVVCPAVAGVLWRASAWYDAA